jgi:translation initiation factor 2 subunit 2
MEEIDFSQLKKKKKIIIHKEIIKEDLDDYPTLLRRLYQQMGNQTAMSNQIMIPAPKILKDGKRSIITNFVEICDAIHRDKDTVKSFVLTEIRILGCLNNENKLIISDRIKRQTIENALKRYILEYVKCRSCDSLNTKINKIDKTLVCESCQASRFLKI